MEAPGHPDGLTQRVQSQAETQHQYRLLHFHRQQQQLQQGEAQRQHQEKAQRQQQEAQQQQQHADTGSASAATVKLRYQRWYVKHRQEKLEKRCDTTQNRFVVLCCVSTVQRQCIEQPDTMQPYIVPRNRAGVVSIGVRHWRVDRAGGAARCRGV
jgi:hypothetical protein